jgi:polygalacturonase
MISFRPLCATRPRLACVFWLTLVCLFAAITRAAEEKTFDVVSFGAVGDGATLSTAALQKAIDTCSAEGGGAVLVPAGRFLTGTLQLKDNVTLRLATDAVLLGSTNAADYRNVDPFIAGDGIPLGHALIVALDARNVGIEGRGTLDGQGRAVRAAQNPYTVRPFLVRWIRCTNIGVRDITLRNSGAWGMHFFQSKNARVHGVTIRSRGLMNNDGIDVDSCETVRISDCDIDTGDDAICLKATSPLPCRDVIATGCKLKTSCNAIKLGTESLGGFENIQVSNCHVRDTGMAGIALYTVDGGHLKNVTISDIAIAGINVPISIRLGARLKTFRAGDQPKPPGILRDITLRNINATGIKRVGILINGIPNHPVQTLTLENIHIEIPGGGTAEDAKIQLPEKESAYPEMSMFGKIIPAYGIYVRHARDVTFKNVRTTLLSPDARPEKIFIDVEGVTPADFAPAPAPAAAPAGTSP